MKKFRFGLWVALGLLFSQVSSGAVLSGPFQDLKEEIPTASEFTFTRETEYPSLFPPSWKKDRITIIVTGGIFGDASIKGLAYESYENADFSGNVLITTIYGIDLDPFGTGLEITGLDTNLAAVMSFSDEQFIGDSGIIYNGVSLGTPSLAALPRLLPGYDLSPFQGDPNSIVYVFQTTAPSSDFSAVPEPTACYLAGLGVFGYSLRRRRQVA